ncbi:ABC transporter ATP-binding protein [Sediminispirochaeta smaragdinae]|jgi:NitT/TauT family transport system ATP-binding protein|uniref:ABC transporter related protein n=1 Tax=Sediminispirochaeta smaragdinae (strain DSM 11293 / JCM 15392 / SEBR 4228) TaxID=573413 RepID=E1R9H9_SEDSS|nr:ATP-binding cassette domain-containing protein [Sediminispirochaeta smaragdinae]ADK83148.1 ABC transporter related protein [Sediminispirochaeta smaragdinae DSM 11293]
MLELKHCRYAYPEHSDTAVFQDISFIAERGRTIAILGPSGCGKSTLIAMIAGILRGEGEGTISLDSRPIERGHRGIGLIPQHFGLLPWLSVEKNIEVGLQLRRVAKKVRMAKAVEAARAAGIDRYLDRYPAALSGGEQQRVALARALVTEPELLLLDEPFSSLDAITREGLQELLASITDEKMIVVLVTHSIEEAAYLADATLVMSPGPESSGNLIELPPKGEKNQRSSQLYFERCRLLRNALEEACR